MINENEIVDALDICDFRTYENAVSLIFVEGEHCLNLIHVDISSVSHNLDELLIISRLPMISTF